MISSISSSSTLFFLRWGRVGHDLFYDVFFLLHRAWDDVIDDSDFALIVDQSRKCSKDGKKKVDSWYDTGILGNPY